MAVNFSLLHRNTFMDEGVSAHMRGGGFFSWKFSNPITDLVVTIHDEAALIAIQGVTNTKNLRFMRCSEMEF